MPQKQKEDDLDVYLGPNMSQEKFTANIYKDVESLVGPSNCTICDRDVSKSVKVKC
jgi:hypothetical protein